MRSPLLARVLALAAIAAGLLFFVRGVPAAQAGDVPTTVAASHLSGIDADKEDWKGKSRAWYAERLKPQQVSVCRDGGTERAFTGGLLDHKGKDPFVCSSCGLKLFDGAHKFKSGTGWPSFHTAVPGAIREIRDTSHGMVRTEVRCSRCDAHLGHVFDDGPPPTGLRYCINSVCLLVDAPAATQP